MARRPTDRPPLPGPLLGREAESAILTDALSASLEGEGRLVLLCGETGIGKTRLAEQLARIAQWRGAAVLWGTGFEDQGAPPYWPWVQIVRRCADLDSPLARIDLATMELTDLLPEPPQASLSGPDAADPQGMRFRLFDGVTSLLGELARTRPLVLVLDDLHWVDKPSLLLLEFLSRELHGRRILVLACYRSPDLPGDAPLGEHLEQLAHLGVSVNLTGLDEAASRRLIEETAEIPVSDGVAVLVRDRTSGNPLFLREVVRLLHAQGRLAPGAGTGLAPLLPALPRTVREVIDRRIARLSPGCARMLARGSVIGSEIDLELLTAVAGSSGTELTVLLDEAVQAGALVGARGAVTRYRFTHPLLREALYSDLPASERARLHNEVGEVIETKSDDTSERVSALAHHFYLASPVCGPEKALGYAGVAARHALSMLAYEEAAEHFEHALEMHSQLDGELSERAELLLELGDARMRAGDWPASTKACERAAASARRRGDAEQLARAALGLGAGLTGFEVNLEEPSQLPLLEEARAKLRGDSPLRARVLARLSVASTLTRRAEDRAELSQEAIAIARRVGDPEALAYALSSYCDASAGPEHTQERLALASEMVELARRSGSRETELLGRRFRLVALLELGYIAGVDAEIQAFARVADALRQPLYRWYVPL